MKIHWHALDFLALDYMIFILQKSFVAISSIFQNMIKRTPWTIFLPS
jgi:hypothetical protein